GVGEIFLADHLHEEGLADGNVKGVHDSDEESDDDDHPGSADVVNGAAEGESGEEEGEDHRSGLRGDDPAMAIVAVAEISAYGSQHQNGNLIGETEDPEQGRGVGNLVNQPELCGGLHPRADEGDELACDKKLEVAVLQGAKARGHEAEDPPVIGR